MAKDRVDIGFSADVSQAQQLWEAMARGPDQYGDKVEKSMRKGKDSSGQMTGALEGMVLKWLSIGSAIAAATKAVEVFTAANERAKAASDAATLSIDQSFRRFQVQSGLRGTALDQARDTIQQQAVRASLSFQQSEAGATQLISGGMSADEVVQGGGLGALLDIVNANNAGGDQADPETVARALLQFMSASGQELTAANMRRSGVAAQRLFKDTNLQLPDLTNLAAESSGLTQLGNISPEDQLVMFSILRDQLDASKSAVHFRNVVSSLATAGSKSSSVAALKTLGIKPEEVDFVGEGALEVLTRLQQGIEATPDEQRAGALAKLFGKESLGGALTLAGNLDKFGERRGLVSDAAGFDADVGIATSGVSAEERRAEAAREFARFDPDATITAEAVKKNLEALFIERGISPYTREAALNQGRYLGIFGDGAFDAAIGRGETPAQAAHEAIRRAGITDLSEQVEMHIRAMGGDPNAAQPAAPPTGQGDQPRADQGAFANPQRQEIDVRLIDQAGIDIPHEIVARRLSNPFGNVG